MTLVGLISDTHGLLRPQAASALAGVSRILHAGDAGRPEVLAALATIAPVTAVRGNVDFGGWADLLPQRTTAIIEGHAVHLLHNIGELTGGPLHERIEVVVFGHTHRPAVESRGGILYVNPGSAGPRRFHLPISIGFLRLAKDAPPEAWLQTLDI
jgi:putative phosphoesterase